VYAFSFLLMTLPAFGQAVVSTHSGIVHYFEGTVTVAGQPLEARFGRFTTIPDGADLRTEQGRAEILLTPGAILRVNNKSAIRMVDTALASTKVELLAGSAIMESAEPAAGTSVTLVYKDWKITQAHAGVYRVDCDPAKVEVREGSVEVAAVSGDAPVTVEKGMDLPFEKILTPDPAPFQPSDAFTDWADGRAQSISADNAIAADIQDPANITGATFPTDGFTYFPLLGFPSPVSSLGSYGSLGLTPGLYGTSPLVQTGFYSIYLPGYTYRPLLLRLPLGSGGLGRSLFTPVRPPLGSPLRLPVTRPITPPVSRPAVANPPVSRPAVAHPVVHPVVIHK
jgi:hypothetical protein